MKKYFLHFILYFMTSLAILSSCKPKDGEIGPKGETGDPGATGQTGIIGDNGQAIFRNGFISGHVTGLGKDGVTPINESFKYEFSESSTPTVLTKTIRNGVESSIYNININRSDSINTSFIALEFSVSTNLFSIGPSFKGKLNLLKNIGGNQYRQLNGYYNVYQSEASNSSVYNLNYNPSTGLLTGNYTWSVDNTRVNDLNNNYFSYSNTGQPFSVTGAFSVKCVERTIIY